MNGLNVGKYTVVMVPMECGNSWKFKGKGLGNWLVDR